MKLHDYVTHVQETKKGIIVTKADSSTMKLTWEEIWLLIKQRSPLCKAESENEK